MCFVQKSKKHNNNKTDYKHKNHFQNLEWNPGPLEPRSDALPLNHRVIWTDWLESCFLTVSLQWVETSTNTAKFADHTFQNIYNILTCIDTYISQILIFMGVWFTAKYN